MNEPRCTDRDKIAAMEVSEIRSFVGVFRP